MGVEISRKVHEGYSGQTRDNVYSFSGAQLRFKFRLYLPVCQSLPLRDYLCHPKLMQDLENAGFKLFTQMH